ncbi:MAG TPA: CoA pyrophosphatase [Thermoanaerobaculia bacterium]|nr:CoA pyrophosphatase [Thermoanaerobaculia bacterium]
MPFTIEQIREALGRHQPTLVAREATHAEAAVALILAGSGSDLSLCAIRRAEHPLDPWSGHMALPGGRADPEDVGPRAAAERETLEEIGLSLAEEHWVGSLSHVLVRLGGGDRRMVLSPFVYHVGEELLPFAPNEEVAEAYWIPLSHLWDPRNSSSLEWERSGARLLYPAIRFRDTAIWGITFRVLTLFSDVLDAPLPHLEEIPGLGR